MKNIEIKNNTKCNVECQVIDDTTTRIVINDEYVPKDGDFVYCKVKGQNAWVFIHKQTIDDITSHYVTTTLDYDFLDENRYICKNHQVDVLRPATPEEIQHLTDKLKEQGKRWNAEKKVIEGIPTFKVGDWFIPHKPEINTKAPIWATAMNKYDGLKLKVERISQDGCIESDGWRFQLGWCEKAEAPKPEPKVGEMCIFWDNDKREAICGIWKAHYEEGSYYTNEDISYNNCILFESVEQYKKIVSND